MRVPERWRSSNIGAIVSHKKGFAFKSTSFGFKEGRRVIRVSDTNAHSIKNDEPIYLSEAEAKHYGEYELHPGDIILTTVGSRPPLYDSMVGKAIKVPVSIDGALLNQNMVKLTPVKEFIEPNYLYSLLKTKKFLFHIEQSVRGNANQVSITLDDIFNFSILLPPLEEQQKIAEILITWDKAIEKLEALIAAKQKRKKALMQQFLTGKKRLAGFVDDWKDVSIGNVFKKITRKNSERHRDVVTISAQKGLIKQDEFFNKNVASETLDHYFLLKKGEFAYNKSYSNGYPMGAVKRLNFFDKAVVTTLYICFAIKDQNCSCSSFFEQYFESGRLIHGLMRIANEGGRAHGLLNVTPKEFFALKLIVPDFEEQQKIATILSTADNEIETHQKQLEALKQQKKGLMQQLLTGKKRVKVDETAS